MQPPRRTCQEMMALFGGQRSHANLSMQEKYCRGLDEYSKAGLARLGQPATEAQVYDISVRATVHATRLIYKDALESKDPVCLMVAVNGVFEISELRADQVRSLIEINRKLQAELVACESVVRRESL